MARMLGRQMGGNGLLCRWGRCRCPDCWAPRVSRSMVRIVRHRQKRLERRAWQRDARA